MVRKSKLLKSYQDRTRGSLFIRSTRVDENDEFVLKPDTYGKAVSGKISDAELGKTVREILANCE